MSERLPKPLPEPISGPDAHSADGPLRLVVLVASTRPGRFGPTVARWFTGAVREHGGFDVDVLDLAETPLPAVLPDFSTGPTPAEAELYARVTPRLAAAEAFVVVTCEYNHSYPAPLKNAIDLHGPEWHAKPVGFVSYGGLSGGLRAVEHLRPVFAEVHAATVRDTVSFHGAAAVFGPDGQPLDTTGPAAAAKALLDQLEWWGLALREARARRPYKG